MLKLLVLRCADLKKSKRFYSALGMQFVEEQHGSGPLHYSTVIDDIVLELYPASQAPADDLRLGFVVTDMEAVRNACEIVQEFKRDNTQISIVIDPDGRRIELYSY